MPNEGLNALRAEYAEIASRLQRDATHLDRAAIKAEIAALFKRVEQQVAQLLELKEDIKQLASRWKALPYAEATESPSPAPQVTPRHMYADHIGASTWVEKGWTLLSLGDYVAAQHALSEALELSPDDLYAASLLGWAQMLQQQYDQALAQFQKVLAREPGNALARTNLGYICLKKRIFGEAIEHLSKAIRLDNDRKATLYAHFYLGLVYSEREMYGDAEIFFRKALELGPNLVEVYYELGRALWFGGRHGPAMQAWRDGLVANKFSPWSERCGEMLKRVEDGGAPGRDS